MYINLNILRRNMKIDENRLIYKDWKIKFPIDDIRLKR